MALLILGCATKRATQDIDAPPQPISVSTVPYEMAVLDSADITFADGRRETVTIGQDGAILTPGGEDRVVGMSREDFEALLKRRFPGAKSIEVNEFTPDEISILGEVFHQIHTTMGGGPMRVLDGIASANGFTPLANKRRVKLVRQNAGRIEVYELDLREMMRGRGLAQNLLLQPGDVITVPRNFL